MESLNSPEQLSNAINTLLTRHQALLRAVCSLVRTQSDESKRAFAADIRVRLADLLQDAAELMTPDMDAVVTLDLAALLESADQPPGL